MRHEDPRDDDDVFELSMEPYLSDEDYEYDEDDDEPFDDGDEDDTDFDEGKST
jgi:23S rRNA pseudouridine1911/1915/1917 synthase